MGKDEIQLATENAMQRISQHTNMCLRKVEKEFDRLDPRKQLNLKKTLLKQIPEKPMRLDIYMDVIRVALGKHNVQVTPQEYELLIRRLGLVVDNLVSSTYNPENLRIALEIV